MRKKKGGEQKKVMVTLSLSFFLVLTLEVVLAEKKNCWMQKVHFKNLARYIL